MIVSQRTNVTVVSDPDRMVIPAQFIYDPADPYAVFLEFFFPDGSSVDWMMSRELLVELFVNVAAGDCDVKWKRIGECCILYLSSPEGDGIVKFETKDVKEFLDYSKLEVAVGAEKIDTDAMITRLLENR